MTKIIAKFVPCCETCRFQLEIQQMNLLVNPPGLPTPLLGWEWTGRGNNEGAGRWGEEGGDAHPLYCICPTYEILEKVRRCECGARCSSHSQDATSLYNCRADWMERDELRPGNHYM